MVMEYRPGRSEFSTRAKDGWHHPDDSSVNREGDAKRLGGQPVRRQRARPSPLRTIAVFLLAKLSLPPVVIVLFALNQSLKHLGLLLTSNRLSMSTTARGQEQTRT